MHLTTTIAAGGRLEFHEEGDFFRFMEGDAPVSVEFYRRGALVAKAENVSEGYAEQFIDGNRFDRLAITSASAQTIQIAARLGGIIAYDTPPVGNVAITNTGGAFTQQAKNVTTAPGVLLAAKANRRYLLIQNWHASAILYVHLAGGTTYGTGIKVSPGSALEIAGYVPTGEITAWGSAVFGDITVVEG